MCLSPTNRIIPCLMPTNKIITCLTPTNIASSHVLRRQIRKPCSFADQSERIAVSPTNQNALQFRRPIKKPGSFAQQSERQAVSPTNQKALLSRRPIRKSRGKNTRLIRRILKNANSLVKVFSFIIFCSASSLTPSHPPPPHFDLGSIFLQL